MRKNEWLMRAELGEKLVQMGYPVPLATLNYWASYGGGPKFERRSGMGRVGNKPAYYRWGDVLAWLKTENVPNLRYHCTRNHLPAALLRAGYQYTYASLTVIGGRGDGPPGQRFGRDNWYNIKDAIHWAKDRKAAQKARRTRRLCPNCVCVCGKFPA